MAFKKMKSGNEILAMGEELLKKVFEEIRKIINPTMTIEELEIIYAKALDKIILETEKNESKTYIGGEFVISYVNKKSYACEYSLYFQDNKEKIYAVKAESGNLNIKDLSEDTVKLIVDEGKIKFDIPSPSEEVRKEFNQQV